MTLHTIFQHLRKNNPGEYRLFLGCNTFAILLISSFLAVLTSPLVQSVLPEASRFTSYLRRRSLAVFFLPFIPHPCFCVIKAGKQES